jgi:opacity protein-like surface antigen
MAMRSRLALMVPVAVVALLGAVSPGVARAAEPAAPAPAPAAAPAPDDGARWGLVARGGLFGVPNLVADEFFAQHPDIEGAFAGAEIRYFGDGGGRGVSSIGLAIDHGEGDADGTWQADDDDRPTVADGSVEMTAVTLTGYWNLFPSWWLHPYIGLGVGVGWFKGEYADENGPITVEGWLPVVHVPVGLALELGRALQLSAEVRFIDGFTGGAALLLRF